MAYREPARGTNTLVLNVVMNSSIDKCFNSFSDLLACSDANGNSSNNSFHTISVKATIAWNQCATKGPRCLLAVISCSKLVVLKRVGTGLPQPLYWLLSLRVISLNILVYSKSALTLSLTFIAPTRTSMFGVKWNVLYQNLNSSVE